MPLPFDDLSADQLIKDATAEAQVLRGQNTTRESAADVAIQDFSGGYKNLFTQACPAELPVRRSVGVGAILLMIGLTAGCMESEPPGVQEYTLNACDLIETATVEALIGDIKSQEEPAYKDSMPRGSGPTCKYYPADTSYSPLEMRVNRKNQNTVALMGNATGCDESMPLEVDEAVGFLCADVGTGGLPGASLKATWSDDPVYYTSIYFVIDKDGQSFAEIEAAMQDAVKDLMKNVDEDSFAPQPLTP